MRTALTIAGSDSVGGAGVQADIKAMSTVGVHCTCAITAVTSQNTRRVKDIYPVPPEIVVSQIETVMEDCDVSAIKTGMLYSGKTVKAVADKLEDYDVPIIVDPVMVATVGDSLGDDSLVNALKKELLPLCSLVTPNRHEAEILANMKIRTADDAMLACEIIGKGGTSVLLKGGHMDTSNVIDYLYLSSEFTEITNNRLAKAGHGSGCTFSAFITAHLAEGNNLIDSVVRSRALIQQSIASQYAIGRGEVVVNPLVRGGKDTKTYPVLEAVDEATRRLVDILPRTMVPKNGANIAFAMQNATGPEGIAGIEGRIKMHNGVLSKSGPAKLGAAEQLSFFLMEIMKVNPKLRCILSITDADDASSILEEVGMTAVRYSSKKDRSVSECMKRVLSGYKRIPDALVDRDDGTMKIIGKDPADVISKLESIL